MESIRSRSNSCSEEIEEVDTSEEMEEREEGDVEEVENEEEEELEKEEEIGKSRTDQNSLNLLAGVRGQVLEFLPQNQHRKSVRHKSLTVLKTKSATFHPYRQGTNFTLQPTQSMFSLDESSRNRTRLMSQDLTTSESDICTPSDSMREKKKLQLTEKNVEDLLEAIHAENEVIKTEFKEVNTICSAGDELSTKERMDSAVNSLKKAFVVIPTLSSNMDCITSTEKKLFDPSTIFSGRLDPEKREYCQQNDGGKCENNTMKPSSNNQYVKTLKPSFHVKPVLLNYDASKPTHSYAEPAKTTARESQMNHPFSSQIGEVRTSITGHTLKIITDKVRAMDCK